MGLTKNRISDILIRKPKKEEKGGKRRKQLPRSALGQMAGLLWRSAGRQARLGGERKPGGENRPEANRPRHDRKLDSQTIWPEPGRIDQPGGTRRTQGSLSPAEAAPDELHRLRLLRSLAYGGHLPKLRCSPLRKRRLKTPVPRLQIAGFFYFCEKKLKNSTTCGYSVDFSFSFDKNRVLI